MEDEAIVTRTGKAWIGEDGIVHFTFFPGAEQTLADAEETIAATKKLAKDEKLPIIIDMRNLKSMDREARRHYSRHESGEVISACAVLIGSFISRVVGSFLTGLDKTVFPTRLFTSETEAVEWLRGAPA